MVEEKNLIGLLDTHLSRYYKYRCRCFSGEGLHLIILALNKRRNIMKNLTKHTTNPFDFFQQTANDLFSFDFFQMEKPLRENPSYPPYNIAKSNDGSEYTINMAVAGLNKDDIDVYIKNDRLNIEYDASESEDNESENFVYKGIAKRSFKTMFTMPKNSEISDCSLTNGMLSVKIKKNETKPEDNVKRIPIN